MAGTESSAAALQERSLLTSNTAHLNHLLGHCWGHIHTALIALLRHGHIACCQVCCCLGTCFCTCPAYSTGICKHGCNVGLKQ